MTNRFAFSLAAAVAACFSTQATSQIAGDTYVVTPALGDAVNGFNVSSFTPLTDATINGASDVVGSALAIVAGAIVQGADIIETDTVVPNGAGGFTVTIRCESTDDLTPAGIAFGGNPADTAGFFVGNNFQNAVSFSNAAIVNTADITLFDAAGVVVGGPFDISAFANFSALAGGWDGNLGVTFGAGSAGGIFAFELVVDYTPGGALGAFTSSGTGCPAGAEVLLTSDTFSPAIGQSITLTAAPLPANSIFASLLLGLSAGGPLPLDILGATGCFLEVPIVTVTAPLTISAAMDEATLTLPIPNDPSIVGFALDSQAAVIAPGVNPFDLVLSDLGSILVGEV